MLRKTFVEIDLNAIKHNLINIKKFIGENVKILLPVKADAYGHGIVEISRFVELNSLADILGVASLDEGIELRHAGITLPILVLGLIIPGEKEINIIFDYSLSQTVAYPDLATAISNIGQRLHKTAHIHLKIDTGMGRIGCKSDEAVTIIKEISLMKNINLEGIYSHFPDADGNNRDFTMMQIEKFKNIITEIKNYDIHIPYRHISNSAGIINYHESIFNMVRPGIMSYGYLSTTTLKSSIDIKPSMTFKSNIVFIKRVKKGTPLSYGLTYTTNNDLNIATVPVGYGDGYSRFLSNKGMVLINNKTYPVVGRVTMDQILVNLGDDYYPLGEEVILFGKEPLTINKIAEWIGTIPYEVTCNISKRVPRVYID